MTKHWWARTIVGHTPVSNPLSDERPDPAFELEWRSRVKARVLIVLGCLAVWAVGVEARLVWVQVVSHHDYLEQANSQQAEIEPLTAPRGDILDRQGRLLATTVQTYELGANTKDVKDPAAEARELCAALRDCAPGEQASIEAKLGESSKKWVVLRRSRDMSLNAGLGVRALLERRAGENKKRKARDQKPSVFTLSEQTQRYYPKKDVAGQVIGYLRADGSAGGGIEAKLNDELKGVDGEALALRDALRHEIYTSVQKAPRPGASVELTIDVTLQAAAQRYLEQAVTDSGALAGTVIVLQAGTGEIFVDASYPPYDPNNYRNTAGESNRNRAVQDAFEPGSTMKIVTLSAAINEGVLTPTSLIDANPFSLPGRTRPIGEAHGRNWGVLTLEDVLVQSSNRGAARIGLRVGAEALAATARRFGLGQRVSDLPGEEPGTVPKLSRLTDSALASMAYGYGIGVTPMQMATVASVIANGGVLIKPHVVRAIIRDGQRVETRPEFVRRVISPETAQTMIAMLESVVQRGTGKSAAFERYLVAGKTGTAQVAATGYSGEDNNVSFDGIVPSRQPEFIIFVLLNSPRGGTSSGSAIAAPVFKQVADAALRYTGVLPSINPAPPVIVAADRPGRPLPSRPATITPARLNTGGMPDLRGLTLRDAVRAGHAVGIELSVDGDGVVVAQSPAAGEPIDGVSHGVLQLRRDPAKAAGGER